MDIMVDSHFDVDDVHCSSSAPSNVLLVDLEPTNRYHTQLYRCEVNESIAPSNDR